MALWFKLIAHLLVTLARLAGPGGVRAVAAESVAVKLWLLKTPKAVKSPEFLGSTANVAGSSSAAFFLASSSTRSTLLFVISSS